MAKDDAEGIRSMGDFSFMLQSFFGPIGKLRVNSPLPAGTFKLVAIKTFAKVENSDGGDPHLNRLMGILHTCLIILLNCYPHQPDSQGRQVVKYVEKKALVYLRPRQMTET